MPRRIEMQFKQWGTTDSVKQGNKDEKPLNTYADLVYVINRDHTEWYLRLHSMYSIHKLLDTCRMADFML